MKVTYKKTVILNKKAKKGPKFTFIFEIAFLGAYPCLDNFIFLKSSQNSAPFDTHILKKCLTHI
jgi:hypothetical protein